MTSLRLWGLFDAACVTFGTLHTETRLKVESALLANLASLCVRLFFVGVSPLVVFRLAVTFITVWYGTLYLGPGRFVRRTIAIGWSVITLVLRGGATAWMVARIHACGG